MMRKIALIVIPIALLLGACGKPEPVTQLSGYAQGTIWHVSLWKTGGVDHEALQQGIERELIRLDQQLSNYRPDSVIEHFNMTDTTEAQQVGPEIVSLVETAGKISAATDGCYDLTIKPLFELWGFSDRQLIPPTSERLTEKQSEVGFRHLTILPPDRLQKSLPGLRVDLSSIGQGYSVARLAELVEEAGIRNYIVEIGGEMVVRGHKPDGSYWRIGVERPLPGQRAVTKTLTVQGDAPLAVMTSGTYRHYYDQEGKRYSHVLDARTGRPVTHDTVSVTVLHDDPTLADGWSTALLCLGQEAGLKAAEQAGIAALFISDQDGQLNEVTTAAWRNFRQVQIE